MEIQGTQNKQNSEDRKTELKDANLLILKLTTKKQYSSNGSIGTKTDIAINGIELRFRK
jgi:hypothetical protein